jgi:hypothetical protein
MTAVEWLKQQVILETNLPLNLENVLVFNKLIEQAKEIEKEQNEKYNELKEVIENIIEHLDEGRVLTLRKDSIIVEALRNSINKK